MFELRCPNCMNPATEYVCPICGFDSRKIQPPHYLPYNSRLQGRYIIGRTLGQGGFGITYVAYDAKLDIKVAIKEYYPSKMVTRNCTISNSVTWYTGLQDDNYVVRAKENFLAEARKMAGMDRMTQIVRVWDTFSENNTSYIVMEYVEGITLKKWVEGNGPIHWKIVLEMMTPVMDDLIRAHENGLIHKDISPDNFMIGPYGTVMLMDLGAAVDLKTGLFTEELIVKNGYSPVEQYSANGLIGPWTDVYAFCATIYYCITGQTMTSSMERTREDRPIFPPGGGSRPPTYIRRALRSGLEVLPEHRTFDMAELELDLRTGRYGAFANQSTGARIVMFLLVFLIVFAMVFGILVFLL